MQESSQKQRIAIMPSCETWNNEEKPVFTQFILSTYLFREICKTKTCRLDSEVPHEHPQTGNICFINNNFQQSVAIL